MAAYENKAIEAKMFLTTGKVIGTAEEKRQLAPFADAVDMESFAILSVAKQKKLSAVVIPVISDRFDEDIPADISTTVDERGRVKIGGVVQLGGDTPLQLPALTRLRVHTCTPSESRLHLPLNF